jgi:myo-inositol 2-dehydrogenase/D-chiro-inositol 1-dehydrogenase
MAKRKTQARIGFVGAGAHANWALYPSLRGAPSARLAAVCDLDAGRAERAARSYGADRWYTDVEEMLAAEQLDGVCICGAPQMHVEVGRQVLRRGLPIFVEKPSALTSRDARRLADAAQRAGAWGMVAFMKRYAAGYVLAKQLIEAPAFGGLQQLHLRFTQGEYPDIWGLDAPYAFLVGQVVHIFDLARFLGGDVAEVHARLHMVTKHRFAYAISVEFVSGAVGTLELNTLDHTEAWRDITEYADASGVGESVMVRDMLQVTHYAAKDWRPEPQTWGAATRAWAPIWTGVGQGLTLTGYVGELEQFAQSLLSGVPAAASLWDGVEALRLSEAVWKSAQTGRVVALAQRAE